VPAVEEFSDVDSQLNMNAAKFTALQREVNKIELPAKG